ncbi:uncharacterized protein METZ01_LOCUS414925, partial [marine metagenome]
QLLNMYVPVSLQINLNFDFSSQQQLVSMT